MSPNRTIRLTPRQAVWALISLTIVITTSVLVVAALVSATKTTKIRSDQVDNTETIDNTAQTLDILLDCTTPEGECYKRGQANTQGAVEDITKYAVYAAVCVDEPGRQTVKETTACILELADADAQALDRKDKKDD